VALGLWFRIKNNITPSALTIFAVADVHNITTTVQRLTIAHQKARLSQSVRTMPCSVLSLFNAHISGELREYRHKLIYSFCCKCSFLSGGENKSSVVADMRPERLYERICQRPPHDCENNVSPTFDAVSEGDPRKLYGSYLV